MRFYKTNSNYRTTYTYQSATGEKITFAPGDADGEVTAELIKFLHSLDDSEIYNNRKNCRPPLSDEEKAMIREWGDPILERKFQRTGPCPLMHFLKMWIPIWIAVTL